MGQVTHALLTRPPLSHKAFQSEEIKAECFARLACVRHAASVHPEPGSNSLIKCLFQVMINSRLSKPFTVLVRWTVFKNECKRIFSSCVSLFSYQGPCLATAILDYHIFSGLSRTFFIFLKISFFKIFQFFSTALIDYHKPFCLSRTFFQVF